MVWSFSFQMMPGESIDDSARRKYSGIKPAYSVYLTNKRAIFHFDALGSFLSQSFFFDEILDIKVVKRLFIDYLCVKTKKNEHFFQVSEADYWQEKILSAKESSIRLSEGTEPARSLPTGREKRELLDMLLMLRKNSLLTDEELENKIRILDSMKL